MLSVMSNAARVNIDCRVVGLSSDWFGGMMVDFQSPPTFQMLGETNSP